MDFNWSLSHDLNKAVVWMITAHPLISMSSIPCINSFVTASRVPIITDITVTLLFLCLFLFFQFSSKVQILIILFAFCQFLSAVSRDSKVHSSACSLFLGEFFLFFIYCRRFVLILVVFFCCFFFTTFRPNFTSGLLQVINRDLRGECWVL